MTIRFSRFDMLVIAAVILAGAIGVWLLAWLLGGASIVITNGPGANPTGPISSLSGMPCEHYDRRPIAVMLASDPEARPLSGIGQADMVFEMPVTPNGITRMMAVYQCNAPDELGSIRSARLDFLPLAQGLDAILVHWGGERDALTLLDDGIMDNVDALKYEGTTFYRKNGIPAPHDGFTTSELIGKRVTTLGYAATTSFDGYTRTTTASNRSLGSLSDTMGVDWPQGMDVEFIYDGATNTYLRERGGEPEIDAATDQQVRANVVVLLNTESSLLRDQYLSVQTTGNGVATIWQNGQRINALWKKENATAMLQLTDAKGSAIPLERGTVWFLIDAPLPSQ
ncbi:MAG: hypothetical protein QG615_12 [Nitrospirota bacterium]|nr:hypothetical protein [Nitrospirota bacterium]